MSRNEAVKVCLAVLPLLSFPCAPAAPEGPGARPPAAGPYVVNAATSEIHVDGVLDEPAWADALVVSLDHEWFPGDGVSPPVRTEALITYDERNLYVAFRCQDPDPRQIRAHLLDRDQIDTFVQDDHVTLMIDPFNDERRGFQFRVNPLGVQADAIFSEIEGIEDFSWDIIWKSRGRVTEDGWVAELAIPLNQIRFPAGAEPQTWGFDLGRSYPRNVRHRIASYYRDRNVNCVLCQVDKVSGFQGLRPGKNIELDPTLTATRKDELDAFPDGALVRGDEDLEPGLTARWSVTANQTVNAALNPDFSQVEADAVQLEANERFALFFPEKRPFFLEGIDFFATPLDAVYTRTVRDPRWGAKYTSKLGRNALGFFAAEDDAPPLVLIPFNQLTGAFIPQERITTGVARYRRDVGPRSTVGLLYTGREAKGGDYHNRVGGVDGFFRLGDRNTIALQYLRSDTLYPEGSLDPAWNQTTGESFSDDSILAEWHYASRSWRGEIEFEDRGAGFRADAGFLPRVNVRQLNLELERTFWGGPQDWYSQIQVGGWGYRAETQDGELSDQSRGLYGTLAGPLQSVVAFSLEQYDVLNSLRELGIVDPPPTLFEGLRRVELQAEFQPGGAWKLRAYFTAGDAVDFARNRQADQVRFSPGLEVKAGRHFNVRLDHSFNRLKDAGEKLLEEQVTELRLVYQFSLRTFVRAIVQRRLTERPPDPRAEDFFGQLLFSYKLNPQTVLFAGYEDSRTDTLGELHNAGLVRTDRYFFLKLGYAWLI